MSFNLVSLTRTVGAGSPLAVTTVGGFNTGYFTVAQSYSYVFTATSTASLSIQALGNNVTTGVNAVFDNFSLIEAIEDRSYKAQWATLTGTLTKTQLATGTSLVGYSGFGATNYARESYSADLDFGTGEWNAGAWVNVPATLPAYGSAGLGPELVTNGSFGTSTGWSLGSGWSITGGQLVGTSVTGYSGASFANTAIIPYRVYKVVFDCTVTSGTLGFAVGASGQNIDIVNATGSYTRYIAATAASVSEFYFRANPDFTGTVDNVSVKELIPYRIFDRAFSAGPRISLSVTPAGYFTAEAFDGTRRPVVGSMGASGRTVRAAELGVPAIAGARALLPLPRKLWFLWEMLRVNSLLEAPVKL